MSQFLSARTGPYMHSPGMRWAKTFRQPGGKGTRNFTILIASAFNVGGFLIPELNGVVVLDEDNSRIVADQARRAPSGIAGPSRVQLQLAKDLNQAPWGEFVGTLLGIAKFRDCLEAGPIQWVLPTRKVALMLEAAAPAGAASN